MAMRRTWGLGILCSLLAGCAGSLFGGRPEPTLEGKNGSITLSKLEVLLEGFCDRSAVLIAAASDAVEQEPGLTPEQRSLAHRLKTTNAMAVYDIVTTPNTLGHLADLYVLVNLQYLVWITEGQAQRFFGDAGMGHLKAAMEELKREISHIAGLAMKPDRRTGLDKQIREWRLRNPQTRFVSMIRFESLNGGDGKSPLETVNSLFDILNPLDEPSQQVENAKNTVERMFYYGKRLPVIVLWQAETALSETIASPAIGRLLNNANQMSLSIDRFTQAVEAMPQSVAAERKAILAAFDTREEKLNSTMKEIRSTLSEAREFSTTLSGTAHAWHDAAAQMNELAKSVNVAVKQIEKLAEPSKTPPAGPRGRPFDITEYTAAAAEGTKLADEVRTTIAETNSLLESPAWSRRQQDVDRLTQQALVHAGAQGRDWVDHLMVRLVEVLVVFFVLLLLYRVTCQRMFRRQAGG